MSDPFDFGKEERKLLLVHNERTKLRANARQALKRLGRRRLHRSDRFDVQ
jgi:hypothetical protein